MPAVDGRPILFQDLDDVVCLNNPYGGHDVARAFSRASFAVNVIPLDANIKLWEQLFDTKAVGLLRSVHDEFYPQYVLSTSWWWLLDERSLRDMLTRGGLAFVADNLHLDWATPKARRPSSRAEEIDWWLNAHPEVANDWVILDDELSGTGLANGQPEERLPFIVLCRENVGLTEAEYNKLRSAFLLRAAPTRDAG